MWSARPAPPRRRQAARAQPPRHGVNHQGAEYRAPNTRLTADQRRMFGAMTRCRWYKTHLLQVEERARCFPLHLLGRVVSKRPIAAVAGSTSQSQISALGQPAVSHPHPARVTGRALARTFGVCHLTWTTPPVRRHNRTFGLVTRKNFLHSIPLVTMTRLRIFVSQKSKATNLLSAHQGIGQPPSLPHSPSNRE